MQPGKRLQSGFTIVEMLVAMVILSVGLLGLAELQVTAMKANSKSEGIMASNSLAQMALEEVMSRPPSDPLFNSAVNNQVWGSYDIEGSGTYNVRYDVETNYGGVTNLCLVRVRVTHATSSQFTIYGIRPVTMTALKRST
ncbi:MAG: prepilin-type N-terminal cleavage/methylation domain-containing protein [Desulfuromonas sp.]|nr:prepilin-type N-terminal cleavage/methylation domain-containing protein [Desulfuromonas sp.]